MNQGRKAERSRGAEGGSISEYDYGTRTDLAVAVSSPLPGRAPSSGAGAASSTTCALIVAALLALQGLAFVPERVSAQGFGPSLAGAAAGLGAGVYTSMAVHVVRAQLGSYLFSADEFFELRFESIPMMAGPVAGAVLGSEDSAALWRAIAWGGVGGVVGAAAGYGAGALLSDESESRWAGLVIGSATGLLVGSILSASGGDADVEPVETFSIRIPIG